jgi:hypothetical protein
MPIKPHLTFLKEKHQLKIVNESGSWGTVVRIEGGWNWLRVVSIIFVITGVESSGFS